jgi:serine/threonine protein kinase
MEFIDGQDLNSFIQQKIDKNEHFSEKFICKIFAQTLSALFHCHSLHIIHRDIKPQSSVLN